MKSGYPLQWPKGLLLLLCTLLAGNVCAQTWCTPTYTFACTSNDYIDGFSTSNGITNITNLGTGCSNTTTNYTYFSNMTHTAAIGMQVNFTIVNTPSWSQGYKIWVDYNNNGSFLDPGELVYSPSSTLAGGGTAIGNFTVPVGVVPGMKRMRVRCVFASTTFDPCGLESFGETEDYNLLVSSPAPPALSANDPICEGEKLIIQATNIDPTISSYSFYWKLPNNQTFIGDSIVINNAQPLDSGDYKVYTISGTDTSVANIIHITVHPTPALPGISSVINYCLNDPASPLNPQGQNIKWYSQPVGGQFTTTAPTPNTSIVNSSTYYVTQTINGCESPRAPVTVNVAPKPPAPEVVSPIFYCQGAAAQPLTAVGTNLRWYLTPTGGVPSTIPPTPSTGVQDTIRWYVSQTVNGCEGPRSKIEIIVTFQPNARILLSRDWVCQYDTVTITYFGNGLPTSAYNWKMPFGGTVLSGSKQGPIVVRLDSPGVQKVKLSVANGTCMSGVTEENIEVRPAPIAQLELSEEICAGETALLNTRFVSFSTDSFRWDFAGAQIAYGNFDDGPFGLIWNTPGERVIELNLIADLCPSLPIRDTVTVRPRPDARIVPLTANDYCAGDSLLFQPINPDAYTYYTWTPEPFFEAETGQPAAYGNVTQTGYIYLTATNRWGCEATDSMMIETKPCCDVYFPTAFSPNDDGKNDRFRPITQGNQILKSMRIYNRWGQVVYETADPKQGWDGTLNGKPQDIGTYFFQLTYQCNDGQHLLEKGEFILVR